MATHGHHVTGRRKAITETVVLDGGLEFNVTRARRIAENYQRETRQPLNNWLVPNDKWPTVEQAAAADLKQLVILATLSLDDSLKKIILAGFAQVRRASTERKTVQLVTLSLSDSVGLLIGERGTKLQNQQRHRRDVARLGCSDCAGGSGSSRLWDF